MKLTHYTAVVATVSLICLGFLPILQPVQASLQGDLEAIEAQLAAIRNQKKGLQGQINSQKNQIGVYSGQIGKLRGEMETLQLSVSELELQIKELEVNIQINEEKIAEQEKQISRHREVIYDLQDEAEYRLFAGYKDFRSRGRNTLDFNQSADVNTYFKDSQYRQIIQDMTSESIVQLLDAKTQLQRDQQDLEEKVTEVKKAKTLVDEQKAQLVAQQDTLKQQMDKYYGQIYVAQSNIAGVQSQLNSVSDQEARKQAEAERIRQQLFNSFSSLPNGSPVYKGTVIGYQGATGNATGPHVHFLVKYNGTLRNPCEFLSGPGCGGSGSLPYPLRGSFYFTSGYGNRCFGGRCSFHGAIDIAHSTWNAPVYATHDGYLQRGVDQYGGLYIIICQNRNNCNSGYQTGYWHFSRY